MILYVFHMILHGFHMILYVFHMILYGFHIFLYGFQWESVEIKKNQKNRETYIKIPHFYPLWGAYLFPDLVLRTPEIIQMFGEESKEWLHDKPLVEVLNLDRFWNSRVKSAYKPLAVASNADENVTGSAK